MAKFVTFEGGEGSGKTTQIRLAADWLKERGIPVLATAEPGGTPLGRKIREILLNRGAWTIGAEAELLLFAAARAQHVRETILPALEAGQWVLCDRFADATLAYQGFGRGLDIAFIRDLNAFSSLSLMPDLTLLFDLPVEIGLARAENRAAGVRPEAAEDRFEQEEQGLSRADPGGVSDAGGRRAGTLPDHRAARGHRAVQNEVCRRLEALV